SGETSDRAADETGWREKVPRAGKPDQMLVVENRPPPCPSYRNMAGTKKKEGTGADNRRHWVPLFERYRVPVVLEHHDHTFKRSRPLLGGTAHKGGVLYLGDGSWGKLRTPRPPERLPHLAVTSKDYHLSLHRLQGEERFHLALDERGRVMDVCRTGQRRAGLVRASG